MKIYTSEKIIAWLALFSGLSISAVAVYYSVAGLVSIFAAAAIPIMIMGVVLELSKLVATVWLKINWTKAPNLIRSYLIVAITILMIITSMGIFGYLSKAHLDQAVPTGDVVDQVALIDEKIKTQKENVDASRKALKQMDEAVDQVMARSSDEKGADKAASLRRSQQKERSQLQNDIAKAQKEISTLNNERAPVAKELRKVEAEVGPIKYIAALIYGDNPDSNLLESAVRWVIITIVIVFDPLAVILLLASQYSFMWFRKAEEDDQPKSINDFVPQPQTLIVEDEEQPTEETRNIDWPPVSSLWPFPSAWAKSETIVEEPKIALPVEEPEVPIQELEEAAEEFYDEDDIDEDDDDDTEEIKIAKRDWKHDNPFDSLKRQRKLYDSGAITKLPWEDYIKPIADFTDDDAAAEAAKWAQEQVEKKASEEESKKKGSDVDGEGRQTADNSTSGEVGYTQNAEQTQSTLWNKLQQAKN
jgi:hypothetical protein